MRALVLFRNDLRVHDNETLLRAQAEADELLCAYALQEKNAFLTDALHDLKTSLNDRGSKLIVKETTPAQLVQALVEEHDIDTVYAQERPHAQELDAINHPLKTYETATLYREEDLLIEVTDKESFLRLTHNLYPPIAFAAPQELSGIDTEQPLIPDLVGPGPTGGETPALQLLDELLSSGGDATQLYAYLENGCLSPRKVFYDALEHERNTNKNTQALRYAMRERDYELLS